ncbi:hypothetical protein DSO57_1029431 [Entomophthora muscae]|uniref:Uncharacterized protein n=1 Tax=Entomophthora muscae TaxID=34485 RepID=A0ACC2RFW9_9FUNG|nr:hypothetical protein DSO57_1029431 [Entomophthora muscae]
MNYIIIFTDVLTDYLGIGGNQPTYAQFSPEPQGPKGILYNELTCLNSMDLNPWTPLASSQPTPNFAKYVIPAATLLYLAGSLRQCNILTKAFCQAIKLYPIVYALNGFEPPDLPSYVTKVLPSILGYYTTLLTMHGKINCSTGLTLSALAFGTADSLKSISQGNPKPVFPVKPPPPPLSVGMIASKGQQSQIR